MSLLDLEAFARARLQRDPCDYVIVPRFLRPEALTCGPACDMLLKEIHSPELRALFAAKSGVNLDPLRLEMTFRRFSDANDGPVHNDSRVKVVTALTYFDESWPHAGGRLRLLRSKRDLHDYAAEVEPAHGNLIAFRRSATSYHGFLRYVGERRSLQMYWARPKKQKRGDKQRSEWLRRFKRLFKTG